MSPQTCTVVYKTIGYQLGSGTLYAEIILSVRTWVIWNRNPRVAFGLAFGLVICWIPIFYFLAQSLNSLNCVWYLPTHVRRSLTAADVSYDTPGAWHTWLLFDQTKTDSVPGLRADIRVRNSWDFFNWLTIGSILNLRRQ